MEDANLTTAMIISHSENLEDATAAFYEELARRHTEHREAFSGAAQDAQKHKVWVVRTYQETISDALEACFCFQGMRLRDYGVELSLEETAPVALALQKAIELEESAISFYQEVAERSKPLLATIPAAFKRVAKKRATRKRHWETLI
jgi:rubrerythrin